MKTLAVWLFFIVFIAGCWFFAAVMEMLTLAIYGVEHLVLTFLIAFLVCFLIAYLQLSEYYRHVAIRNAIFGVFAYGIFALVFEPRVTYDDVIAECVTQDDCERVFIPAWARNVR